MATIKVKASAQLVLRKKWAVLRAIKDWQKADDESEAECEDTMRHAIEELLRNAPIYMDCQTVGELEFRLKQELCPDKMGVEIN